MRFDADTAVARAGAEQGRRPGRRGAGAGGRPGVRTRGWSWPQGEHRATYAPGSSTPICITTPCASRLGPQATSIQSPGSRNVCGPPSSAETLPVGAALSIPAWVGPDQVQSLRRRRDVGVALPPHTGSPRVSGSWWIPVAIVVLVGALLISLAASRTKPVEPVELPPWDWPQDYFDAVGRLGRRIDPMPARLLPIRQPRYRPHRIDRRGHRGDFARTNPNSGSGRLFTSVLLQRREKFEIARRTCSHQDISRPATRCVRGPMRC